MDLAMDVFPTLNHKIFENVDILQLNVRCHYFKASDMSAILTQEVQ